MLARLLARLDDARCDLIAHLLIRAGLITRTKRR